MDKVVVLMSTYNGEKYIREQIESILNQKNVEIELLIRDDGSSDTTLEILDEYIGKDSRITYYTGENLKPAKSFMNLLKEAPQADYYALSDQDDVWDDEKLAVALEKLKILDPEKPALYFSNLKVVDSNLNFIRMAHSQSQFQENKYAALMEPMPTGCTMVFNKHLVELANQREPKWFSMHDSWLYLICMFFGNTYYDFDGYINYRQHENNVIGAYKKKSLKLYITRVKRMFDRSTQPRYENACNFYECYGEMLSNEDRAKVLEIVNYKKSIRAWLKLLFDRSYKASNISREIRKKILILERII